MRCYICNREMKQSRSEADCVQHNEHIIHSGIAGKLTSNTILCKSCGSKYGQEDDAEFVKLFEGPMFMLQQKHKLSTSHSNLENRKIDAYYYPEYDLNNRIPLFYTKGIFRSKKNTYCIDEVNKKIKLFVVVDNDACEKRAREEYEKENEKPCDYSYERCYNIPFDEHIGLVFSDSREYFNSAFAKGLTKIATEFALSKGIAREHLNNVIEIKNNGEAQLKDEVSIIPFVPQTEFDIEYEKNRTILERAYPTHSLILFNQKDNDGHNLLICYVDLFSTFQYYVLLNRNYEGKDIIETYCQRIIKKEIFPLDNNARPKDVDIMRQELNVTYEELEGETLEQCIKYLNTKAESLAYEDVNDNFYALIDAVGENILNQKINQLLLTQNFTIVGYEQSQLIKQQSAKEHFRIHNWINLQKYTSTPEQCLELFETHPEKVRCYTFGKFKKFFNYCIH